MEYCSMSIIASKNKLDSNIIEEIKIDNNVLFEIEKKEKYKDIISPIAINKCNGTILFAKCEDINEKYLSSLLKELWREAVNGKLDKYVTKVEYHYGRDALEYIFESAEGLYSVVYGDIQVTSQICDALLLRENEYKDLVKYIKACDNDVKNNTKTKKGNTAVERILVSEVSKDNIKEITLLGYGKSGQLILKALNEEKIKTHVYNRTVKESLTPGIIIEPLEKYIGKDGESIIIALMVNDETQDFIQKLNVNYKNVYDITSPQITKDIQTFKAQKIMNLSDFAKIATKSEEERKSDKAKTLKIISHYINEFLNDKNKDNYIPLWNIDNKRTIKNVKAYKIITSTIREFCESRDFEEIISPYLLKIWRENKQISANFDPPKNEYIYLRNTPSIVLQMLVNKCFDKVYEIGKSFRNESDINLCPEFLLAHLEWRASSQKELIDVCTMLIKQIIKAFNQAKLTNIEEINNDIPCLTYSEAYEIIKPYIESFKYGDELTVKSNYILLNYVKKKYSVMFFIVRDLPLNFSDFYYRTNENKFVERFILFGGVIDIAKGGIRSNDKNEMLRELNYSEMHRNKTMLSFIDNLNPDITQGGFTLSIDKILVLLLEYMSTKELKLIEDIQI